MKIGIANNEAIRLTGTKQAPKGIHVKLESSERRKQQTPIKRLLTGRLL